MTTTTDGPAHAPLPLLVLGHGRDLASERGVECPGDLPAPSDPDLVARARAAKAALGDRVFVLGHHYQRDEVIEFADVTGDSFKLAKEAAARPDAEWVVFCGVHFMAESADILTADTQTVVLPDLAAGCSMADMAAIDQVEECWDELRRGRRRRPHRAGDLHELLRGHQGVHRAARRHDLHLVQREDGARPGRSTGPGDGGKVLFLPDQHLGRNTYARDLGRPLDGLRRLGPAPPDGRPHPRAAARRHDDPVARALLGARPLLGRGRRGGPARDPRRQGDRAPRVPPRGRRARRRGRLDREDHRRPSPPLPPAPPGPSAPSSTSCSAWRAQFPEQRIAFLEKNVCYCSTMNRIDLPHLVWALESLVDGRVVNPIRVDDAGGRAEARVALDQMLALPGETAQGLTDAREPKRPPSRQPTTRQGRQPAARARCSAADQGRNDSAEAWSQKPWNRALAVPSSELRLDEVVDLAEGQRLELGDPAHAW